MSKTGDGAVPGTAEGAVQTRVAHSLHAPDPVFDDALALHLLSPDTRARAEDPAAYRDELGPDAPDNSWFIAAVGIGSLCHAERVVEQAVVDGIGQYVVMGAGFDTFGLRRADLIPPLSVFEVDHPDVQALKRERVAARSWPTTEPPTFVPVDFEVDDLGRALRDAGLAAEPTVVSWMNTIPYLTAQAAATTLGLLAELLVSGSVLTLNYPCDVALEPEQRAKLQRLRARVAGRGEPHLSRWAPEDFVSLVEANGFRVDEHLTERDLTERFFRDRVDGIAPGVPARLITARRR